MSGQAARTAESLRFLEQPGTFEQPGTAGFDYPVAQYTSNCMRTQADVGTISHLAFSVVNS